MTSRRRILQTVACGAALTAAGSARAQTGDVSAALPIKTPAGMGTGVQLSDSVILHAGVGAEGGYDNNVFYSDNEHKVGSPMIRVLPYLEFTNASRTGIIPSGVFFDLGLAASYRQYLSSAIQPGTTDTKISDQHSFMPSANAMLEFSSGQVLSVTLTDTFLRFEDSPYITLSQGNLTASSPITRYVNVASAQLRWAPGGGRLQGLLRYSNTFDKFGEDSHLDFANSVSHEASVDISWKWLPKTALFVRAAQGYVMYTRSDMNADATLDTQKFDSYPLRVGAGIRGLITQKLSVNLTLAYANAFYTKGPNPEGALGHISVGADLSYKPTVLTSLGLGYHHDFQNSVIGNFYYADGLVGTLIQQIAGRITAIGSIRYERRVFQFLAAQRTDNNVQVAAAVDYHPKPWAYIGAGYSLLMNDAAAPTAAMAPQGVDYTKHQVFVRLGVTY
jgi:hypothetical protein